MKEETKVKIRESVLRRWQDPEYVARHAAGLRAKMSSPEMRAHLSAVPRKPFSAERNAWIGSIHKGMKRSEETKKKMSEARKSHWAKLDATQRRKRMLNMSAAAVRVKVSSLEVAMMKVLDILSVAYVHEAKIGSDLVDLFLPAYNLIIECDGVYWHNLPGMPEHDAIKTERLRSAGFTVIRLPEVEILADPLIALTSRVRL